MNHSENARKTPLYDRHVAAGARMVPFAGWMMPVNFGSQLKEHEATREGCGIFDVSHMGQILIEGYDAIALANQLVTRELETLSVGQQVYTVMCNTEGGILDDLIPAILAPDQVLLVVNAGAYETVVRHIEKFASVARFDDARVRPCSEQWAMLSIQGPKARGICRGVLGEGEWTKLPRMHVEQAERDGRPLLIMTTGYTGEEGIELLCPPESAPALWDDLVDAGAVACGLGARDTLRLEMGFPLSGEDIHPGVNPFEARLAWVVDLDKEGFIGRDALVRIKEDGITRRLMGLLPEGRRIPRHDSPLLAEGEVVGKVTSGGFSPNLGRPIAMGFVRKDQATAGTRVEIDLGGGKTTPAEVVKPPFVKKG